MGDLVLVFIGLIALGFLFVLVLPALRALFLRCPECKGSGIETRDESNEFTGRTYRHWNCMACGHEWSRRLWLQTNNGVDEETIDWPVSHRTSSADPFPSTEDTGITSGNGGAESEDTFGGGSSGGGGAGSSW